MDKFDLDHSQRTLRWYEWLTFLLLFGLIAGVRADPVYKCVDAGGAIAFQTQGCVAAQSQTLVDVAPTPAYVASPIYAVPQDNARVSSATRAYSMPSRRGNAAASPTSYECRTGDGQVFYRHSPCPHSVAAANSSRNKAHGQGAAKSVSVNSIRIPRDEACSQMRRAAAIGRSGREHDQDVSTYDKNLGRDPCR